MTKATSPATSQRMLRVGEQVRAALTKVLQRRDVQDPLLETTVISISEVRMSTDLRIATAFISPLGVSDHQAVIKALARHAKYLRGRIGPELRQLKFMPELRFRDDTSFDNYSKIDALLRSPEVARDLGPSEDEDGAA